ncbi:hypothetical protein D3C80_2223510 [compost metagenome]
MSNAKVVSNSFGEIKIDKDPMAKTKRIDPVDAVIDSHKLTLAMAQSTVDTTEFATDDFLNKLWG